VARFAVQEAQRALQDCLPYVLPVMPAAGAAGAGLEHVCLVGTAADHPWLAELVRRGALAPPPGRQGYTLHVGDSPFHEGCRVIAVLGADAAGVLYGVEELAAHLSAAGGPLDLPERRRQRLDGLEPFTRNEAPAIARRGIWTWGYVIYDYRRFLDTMARLRLNSLTMWNDTAPLNLAEILDYAHSRAIEIVAGFHWGWGIDGLNLAAAADRARIKARVVETYRREYAGLPIDGLYFQTLTEHTTQELDGRSVAAWCVELVNDTAAELYRLNPRLAIQFGLHATSIREHYTDLDALDRRVVITWEDAGALPFAYSPDPEAGDGFEKTLDYARRLARLRPGTPFAMVPKGWMCLRWGEEFEHHGAFLLGERRPAFAADRLRARQPEWDRHNQAWLRHYPLAARFYRDILDGRPSSMLVTGLVEDGLLEAAVQPGVALFAETLWNPRQPDAELLARALRPYLCRGATPAPGGAP